MLRHLYSSLHSHEHSYTRPTCHSNHAHIHHHTFITIITVTTSASPATFSSPELSLQTLSSSVVRNPPPSCPQAGKTHLFHVLVGSGEDVELRVCGNDLFPVSGVIEPGTVVHCKQGMGDPIQLKKKKMSAKVTR